MQPEFRRYLELMRQGTSEAAAFAAASAGQTYENVDARLDVARHTNAFHAFVVKVPREPASAVGARRLSDGEAQARLARLHLQWGHRAEGLRLARAVLTADPACEEALRVVVLASLADGDFATALTQADALGRLASPSPGAARRRSPRKTCRPRQ